MHRTSIKKRFLSTSFLINLGLLVLGIILLYIVADYPDMARAFPRLVLMMVLVIIVLDCILFLRRKEEETTVEKVSAGVPRTQIKVVYMVVLMFVFYILLVLIGLIPGTLLFLLLSGWTLGYKKPVRLIVSSAIITAFVYVMFRVIMKSILPEVVIFKLFGE